MTKTLPKKRRKRIMKKTFFGTLTCTLNFGAQIWAVCHDFEAPGFFHFTVFVRNFLPFPCWIGAFNWKTKEWKIKTQSAMEEMPPITSFRNKWNWTHKYQETMSGELDINPILLFFFWAEPTQANLEEIEGQYPTPYLWELPFFGIYMLAVWAFEIANLTYDYIYDLSRTWEKRKKEKNFIQRKYFVDYQKFWGLDYSPWTCEDTEIDAWWWYEEWCMENEMLCCWCQFHNHPPPACLDPMGGPIYHLYPITFILYPNGAIETRGYELCYYGEPLYISCLNMPCEHPGRWYNVPEFCTED